MLPSATVPSEQTSHQTWACVLHASGAALLPLANCATLLYLRYLVYLLDNLHDISEPTDGMCVKQVHVKTGSMLNYNEAKSRRDPTGY